MKGYWIAKYKKAEDVKKLGSYAEKALKAITDFGGKPLVREENILLLRVKNLFEQSFGNLAIMIPH